MPAPYGPSPRWGFHRLEPRWARAIAEGSGAGPRDLVLDVGAGDGSLTAALAATGARVVAFELHDGRCAALRQRFSGNPSVRVVRADVADLLLPKRPFLVVANPPFAVTAALIRRLTHPRSRLERAVLVLPRTHARRWERAALGPFVATVGRSLPRRSTSPPAPADLALLAVGRR